jgi:hypothetical protein
MTMYEIFAAAFGVAGLAWIFASSSTSTARKMWKPGDTALMIGRLLIGLLTIYVLLTAGGIAVVLGLLAAFFGGLHLYFTRPDEDLPRFGTPAPIRWFSSVMDRLERLLVGR